MLNLYGQDSKQMDSTNHSKCTGKTSNDSLRSMFRSLDADFFSDAKVANIELVYGCSLQLQLINTPSVLL